LSISRQSIRTSAEFLVGTFWGISMCSSITRIACFASTTQR
jgi:hypothetical protein